MDVGFEYGEATTWSCRAKAWVEPWEDYVLWKAPQMGVCIHWKCVSCCEVGEEMPTNIVLQQEGVSC